MPNIVISVLTIEGPEEALDAFVTDHRGSDNYEFLVIDRKMVPPGDNESTRRDWMQEYWAISYFITDEDWFVTEPNKRKIIIQTAWDSPVRWMGYASYVYRNIAFTVSSVEPGDPFCYQVKFLNNEVVFEKDYTKTFTKFVMDKSGESITVEDSEKFIRDNKMDSDFLIAFKENVVEIIDEDE